MSMPGIPELIVIFGVLVLLFGGKKLPELGAALGESVRNFRKGLASKDDMPVPMPMPAAKAPKQPEIAAGGPNEPQPREAPKS